MRPLLALVVALTAFAGGASAQFEAPRGQVGLTGQLSQNTGQAGDAYRYSWYLGVDSGYEIARTSKFGFGATWTFGGGQYLFAGETVPDERVRFIEMALGLRARRVIGESTPRFLFVTGGATILRLNRSVPPDDERLYLGPYAAIGLEQFLGAGATVSFAIRYGLIANGPSSFGLRIGVSFGT